MVESGEQNVEDIQLLTETLQLGEESGEQNVIQELRGTLQPKLINKNELKLSLEKHLLEENGPRGNQKKQFQLGNGNLYTNPIKAAASLLKREYGDSFLFDKENDGDAIFIPPVFVSKHHAGKPIQDKTTLSEIKVHYDKLNSNDWFTKDLKAFFLNQTQEYRLKKSEIPEAIDKDDYKGWILRAKIKYLLYQELGEEDSRKSMPKTVKHQTTTFVQTCAENFKQSQTLSTILETTDDLERLVDEEIKKLNEQNLDESTEWFFELQIPTQKTIASLDYKSEKHIRDTSENKEIPAWFRDELKRFCAEQTENNIKSNDYNVWMKSIETKIKAEERPYAVVEWLAKVADIRDDEEIEHWLFNELYTIKEKVLRDSVILRSVDINHSKMKETEFDFLIFVHSQKLLIAVELKRSATSQNIEKVVTQIKHRFDILQSHFGDLLHGWNFFPVFGYHADKDPMNVHQEFKDNLHLINTSMNVEDWLTEVLENGDQSGSGPKNTPQDSNDDSAIKSLEPLKSILQIFIYTIHNSKSSPITAGNWIDYISNTIKAVSNATNIIFYSKQQLEIFCDDSRYRKLIIYGHHGTGKSLLLQEKAKQLKKQNKDLDIKYFVMKPEQNIEKETTELLFYQHLKHREEKDLKGITIHLLDPEEKNLLEKFDNSTRMTAIFCDEFKGTPNNLIGNSDTNAEKWVWLAPDLDKYDPKEESENCSFQRFQLEFNLRNCKKITEHGKTVITEGYRKTHGEPRVLENAPCGEGCHPCNGLDEALKRAKTKTKIGILVIVPPYKDDRLMKFVKDEVDRCIRYDDHLTAKLLEEEEGDKAYKSLKRRIVKGKSETVKQQRTVMIVPYYSVYGFEWNNVIVILPPLDSDANYQNLPYTALNTIMRCTVNLSTVPFKEFAGFESIKKTSECDFMYVF